MHENDQAAKYEQEEKDDSIGLWPLDQSGGEDDDEELSGGEGEPEDEEILFPFSSRSGDPYFNPIHESLLKVLGDRNVSGIRYLLPFNKYHHITGGNVVQDIVQHANAGKTIIIDLANADEIITRYYSKLVSEAIFRSQTVKFTQGTLEDKDHSILFYFEEAHNLFRKDDSDLRSIYNRLAKEGAKNMIGMVYATQSMTTLSPDLLKNTENFFIAHLNDDREIRELTNQYEFKDIALK